MDRRHQTADANYRNNRFPQAIHQSRLAAYKAETVRRNLMADMLHTLRETGKIDAEGEEAEAPLEEIEGR